jgi:hypothetical protein
MRVSAWNGGKNTYGVRVGVPNREAHFDCSWTEIKVEIDGQFHRFRLTPGFWRKCPEFRDRGVPIVREWLRRHFTFDWPDRQPPKFELVPIGGNRFHLEI